MTGEFPHKGPVTRKMFPFDDVIMVSANKQAIKNNIFLFFRVNPGAIRRQNCKRYDNEDFREYKYLHCEKNLYIFTCYSSEYQKTVMS